MNPVIQKLPSKPIGLIPDIFTYAVRGTGKWLLATCAVLSVIASLVSFAPLIGFFAQLFISAYFCSIYLDLVRDTALGGKEAAEFPETSDLIGDILMPFVQVIGVFLLSFGPYLLYAIYMGSGDSPVDYLLIAGGCAYFPMAMLAVVICGSLRAASPLRVLPAIFRAGGLYWFAVLMFVGIYFVEGIIHEVLEGHFIVQPLVMAVVGSWVLMTSARILGIIWRERQDELAWI